MHNSNSLIDGNLHFIKQGMEMLEHLTDRQYMFTHPSHHSSSIGRHMRHVVDHYGCFLNGLDGKIDYDARSRDPRIESSRSNAIKVMAEHSDILAETRESSGLMDQKVMVKSNEGIHGRETPWSSSTIKRELQFLISHTVHHYALIALIMRLQDVNPPENFGVAPSTLEYQRTFQQ